MELGRNTQGEDAGASVAAGESDASAQNNAAPPAEQPTATVSAASGNWAGAVPWVALALLQVLQLALVLYDESQDWGFLGDLWLIFVIAGLGMGIIVWLEAWAFLADRSLIDRALYLVVGLGFLGAVTAPVFPWWEEKSLFLALAAVMVGCTLPLVHLWRRGWRIRIRSRAETLAPRAARPLFQFSIGDLLVGTTGLAVLLALVLADGQPGLPDFVIVGVQIICGAVVVMISLAWRRFWLAAVMCLLIVGLLCVLSMAIVEPRALTELASLLMVATYAGPATASCLVAIGIIRTAGYRLVGN